MKVYHNIPATIGGGGSGNVPAGGSTGHALTKNSGTDYDSGWENLSDTYLAQTQRLAEFNTPTAKTQARTNLGVETIDLGTFN